MIEAHDSITPHVVWGVSDYLDELRRRDAARQTGLMLWISAAIAILAVASVVISSIALART